MRAGAHLRARESSGFTGSLRTEQMTEQFVCRKVLRTESGKEVCERTEPVVLAAHMRCFSEYLVHTRRQTPLESVIMRLARKKGEATNRLSSYV